MSKHQLHKILKEHDADDDLTQSLVIFFQKLQFEKDPSDDAADETKQMNNRAAVQPLPQSQEKPTKQLYKKPSKRIIQPLQSVNKEELPLNEEPPEIKAKHYEMLNLLGSGGMGEVWRVKDVVLNRTLAMKILHAEMTANPTNRRRFIEEAQVCAQLQHPNIVPIHELGERPDGRFYFTMKEIKGRTFQEIIKAVHAVSQNGQWATSSCGWNLFRLMDTFHQVCQAVSYAHSKGVLHRDLKPTNIMIGKYGEVLVVDWGIAKIMLQNQPDEGASTMIITNSSNSISQQTIHGSILGTPNYMAPEQAKGRSSLHDQRTDIYSLGVILFVILSGRKPYAGQKVEEILVQLISEPSPKLRPVDHPSKPSTSSVKSLLPLPDILVEACEKAMAKNPEERFASANDLLELISQWLDGSRRQRQALELVAQAKTLRRQKRNLQMQIEVLKREAEQGLSHVPIWENEEAKSHWWRKERSAAEKEDEVWRLSTEYEHTLLTALNYAPDLQEAREAIIEHYAEAHRSAELKFNRRNAQRQALRIEKQATALPEDNKARIEHFAYLKGTGALSVCFSVENVEILLEQFVPLHRRLVAKPIANLGTKELTKYPLKMGSYRLRLRKKGHLEVLYPVHIGRGEHWDCVDPSGIQCPIHLPKLGELEPNNCFVPAGWFQMGGGLPEANGQQWKRLWLDDFVINTYHITSQQYLDFLNSLVSEGRSQEALQYAPQGRSGAPGVAGALLFRQLEDKTFALQSVDEFTWNPNGPIGMVSYKSCLAYAKWYSRRSKKTWSLPEEQHWEKAARGVDGRSFPWGNEYDPSYCCCVESHKTTPPKHYAVDSFPIDCSVYGVRGTAGLSHDFTSSVWQRSRRHKPEKQFVAMRGGSSYSNVVRLMSPSRSFIDIGHDSRMGTVSFRLWRPYTRT